MTTPRLPKYLTLTAASLMGLSAAEAYELKFGTNLPPVDIHGFASQGFLYSSDYNYLGDSTRGSFRFSEAGLNMSINPLPRTRIAAQAFLFDVGGIGDYEPFLDYASIEYTFNDYFGLRGGRVRRPGGIYNHIQDVDLARTWILLPQGIYDARWRDFNTSIDGGMIFGNVPMGKAGAVSYEAFGGLANVSKTGGIGNLLNNEFWQRGQSPGSPAFSLDSIDPALSAGVQLWWNTPISGLRVGGLFQYVVDFSYGASAPGPLPGSTLKMESESWIPVQQYSLEYIWNSWTFQAEYQNIAPNSDAVTTFNMPPAPSSTVNLTETRNHTDAWYVSAAYRFNKYFEAGAYYGEYYRATSDRGGETLAVSSDGFQKDAALSFRFDPTDWLIFKVEGHYIRGTGLLHNSPDNPSRDNDGWFLFATKATVSF